MKFSEEFIATFDYIGEKLGIVIDWSNENIIPYLTDLVNRFMKYEIISSAVIIVFCLLLIILNLILLKYFLKKKYDTYVFLGITLCVITFASILLIPMEVLDIINAIYLPEKVIYEYMISFNVN